MSLNQFSFVRAKHPVNKKHFIAVLLLLFLFVYIINRPNSFHKETKRLDLKQDDFCHKDRAAFEFVSFCSCDADHRGLHQNVIAYSLYGNFSDPKLFTRYVEPIKIILANISQSYPGK